MTGPTKSHVTSPERTLHRHVRKGARLANLTHIHWRFSLARGINYCHVKATACEFLIPVWSPASLHVIFRNQHCAACGLGVWAAAGTGIDLGSYVTFYCY